MPNHVHVICRLLPGQKLPDVVRSWKVYSAREANRILGRSGALWQREYYDRLIRREGELDRAVQYVLSNPAKAGLEGWKWVWSEGQEALSTAGRETGATGQETCATGRETDVTGHGTGAAGQETGATEASRVNN